ncbi:MAG: hypothetical protein GXP42_04160 [Chloroflexi bacterium]|nr:hypothetical protein [Chloroflexota bacterium]
MNQSPEITPRVYLQKLLQGQKPSRLALGELVVDPTLVREAVGLSPEAALPLDAEKALLKRWGHDLVTTPFSHGWGATQQPDEKEALFRLSYWRQESDLFVFALLDGPFSVAVRALGWEQALVQLAQNTVEWTTLMADAVLNFGLLANEVAQAGADGVIIGDDIAYRRGPYASPQHLRRAYFPYLTLFALTIQDLGLPVLFHSDGNLWPIWDDLLQTGVNGVQGLDPYSAMSLALARERSAPEFCLWGNLDLGWLSRPHDEEAIQRHLHELLDPVKGTAVIFGTSGGLTPGLPLSLLDQLYQAARAFPFDKTVS